MDAFPGMIFAFGLLFGPWLLGPKNEQATEEIPWYLWPLWFINRFYCGFWHRLQVPEMDPLPHEGPVLLVSNHTCGIDHLILQAATRRLLGFVIAKEYYDLPAIHWLCAALGCIPVRRDGRDIGATRAALRALNSGRVVPIFPEGKINPTSGRAFLAPRPGAAWISLKEAVAVIPAYISGTPETNQIPRSLWNPSRARVVFGPPVPLDDLRAAFADGNPQSVEDASSRIMDSIQKLTPLGRLDEQD